MLHADAQPRHAVRDRIAPARRAWGPLVRPFFRKKAVTLATKAQVLQSLVASRLTYNMHVLTKLSPLVLQEWEASMRCKADAGWDGPLPLLDQHIVWVSWSSGPWGSASCGPSPLCEAPGAAFCMVSVVLWTRG